MNLSPLQQDWKQHVESWQSSGFSQNAYCRQHNVNSSQFSYWKRKLAALDTKDSPEAPISAFIPLTVDNTNPNSSGFSLRLPNGCEFSGIDAQHFPMITQLLKALL